MTSNFLRLWGEPWGELGLSGGGPVRGDFLRIGKLYYYEDLWEEGGEATGVRASTVGGWIHVKEGGESKSMK